MESAFENAEQSPDRQPRGGQLILIQARSGSAQAQERLVRSFTPVVAAYLRRHTSARLARYVAEDDLVQEVLLRGIRGLEHLREGADLVDFQKLLFQHARWVLARQGRQAGEFVGETLHGRAPILDPLLERADPQREAESTGPITREDRVRWLHGLLARLDPMYSEALALYLDGSSFADIAARLGIQEEAARKRVLRGAKLLVPLVRRPSDEG